MIERDYYDVLGVRRGATATEIRGAYRHLAGRYSPDINVCDEQGVELFEEITRAYRVLSDSRARAAYDAFAARVRDSRGSPTCAVDQRVDDLHCTVEIDLEETLRGVTTVVAVHREERCEECGGAGGGNREQPAPCSRCGGSGRRAAANRQALTRCESCAGQGWNWPAPCPLCAGRGTRPRATRVRVTVPPGVDTGAQVRLPSEGHAARGTGRRGDLVVITRVRPHPFFTRKGDNLYCSVPITIPEAVLGARIQIPTPDGPGTLTLPSGTQSGQQFRIRGKGCPRLDRGGRGDLFVETRVLIPRNADSVLESALRALERLLPDDPRADLWEPRGGER